ncbi:MAG: MBL fold metallo-hydrolase, partial [Deltaproteobacteria bacterium]|nr:MBL fold metallo-hydrolase [Deltaproteobacteria bacterium]
MKQTHRRDILCWSRFDPARNLDFHSYVWVRKYGNVAVDPLPLSEHDLEHLERLGGVSVVVVTNSDHVRGAEEIAFRFAAEVCGPRGERERFPIHCDRWMGDGEQVVPGLVALELNGSKTPGELALVLEETTLITGDLVRAHRGGALDLLSDEMLTDKPAALAS